MSTFLEKPVVRCKRCNRILKDPRSKKRGFGPECIEAINLEIDLTDEARSGPLDFEGWLCDRCELPTPSGVLHKGQCPYCYYGVSSLSDLDVIPFAEVS